MPSLVIAVAIWERKAQVVGKPWRTDGRAKARKRSDTPKDAGTLGDSREIGSEGFI